jgi:nicotinamidase-related amidase
MILPKDTVLYLIDLQQGFKDNKHWGGKRNNPNCEANCFKLLSKFRDEARPVIHIKHCSISSSSPLHPSHPGNEFIETLKPLSNEDVIEKNVNSGFIGTNLKRLQDHKYNSKNIVVVGFTTNHCVSTTVRMGSNFGYNMYLVNDACATFERVDFDGKLWSAEDIHTVSICNLKDEFATILNTTDILNSQ